MAQNHLLDLGLEDRNGGHLCLPRYVPAQAIDDRVAMVGSAGLVFYFHPDRLGNVLAMAGGTGLITDRYKYSAFGVEEPPPVSANAYRFNGRRFDPETGLYHYRARYYDPSDIGGGRFLEPDPVGYKDQMNLYAYVGNDPLNATDPTGLAKVIYRVDGIIEVIQKFIKNSHVPHPRIQSGSTLFSGVSSAGQNVATQFIPRNDRVATKIVTNNTLNDNNTIG